MAVEAITYTQTPMKLEKAYIMQAVLFELQQTFLRQQQKLDVIDTYRDTYLQDIWLYESGLLSFGDVLQRLQPLEAIPDTGDKNGTLLQFNALVSQINALRNTGAHILVFRKLCLRLQKLLHPEKIGLLEQIETWEIDGKKFS